MSEESTILDTEDEVPSMDSDEPIATYKTWRKEDTRVVTYCIGVEGLFPGIFAVSVDEAIKDCSARWGHIVESNYVPNRAFLRVLKCHANK